MRMKFKMLKKLISVTIICTMIAALFVPTLSVQAAETQVLNNVVKNYTDVENSDYEVTDITYDWGTIYVDYSVPDECQLIIAEYNGVTGALNQIITENLSATAYRTHFYLNNSGNQCTTVKAFIVDSQYRPLGKSCTEKFDITYFSETPSFSDVYDMEPHTAVPLKNDSGKFAYGADWSVNTDGVLSLSGDNTYLYTVGQNTLPWNEYREGITTIDMAENVREIGQYMFQGMNKIKEVTIPAGAYVHERAFFDMPSLETVVLSCFAETDYDYYYNPYIEGGAFMNCPSLKEFIVDENDSQYKAIDGVLYSKDGSRLIRYPAAKTDKTFTIPDTVTSISSYAFEGATNLESVYNVSDISSSHIFANCTSLKKVEFTTEQWNLSISAFCNCEKLTELSLPDDISAVWTDEYSMYKDVTDCMTLGTASLQSINIPANLGINDSEYIVQFTSALPESIKNVKLSEGDERFVFVDGVLYSADMSTLYRCFDSSTRTSFTVPDSVEVISDSAFKNCKNLENIEFGSNVTSIGENAFEGCANLTSVYLTDVSTIEEETFKDCINLEFVELGSVTEIKRKAFDGCKSLVSIFIPASVKKISNAIFTNCDSLESINVDEDNAIFSTYDGCLYQGHFLKEYPNAKAEDYVVSSYTTSIEDSAFEGRNSLKSIVIPYLANGVGDYAFSDCGNLTKVTLSEDISGIGSYAFNNCTSLSEVNIPESIYEIKPFTFANCKSIKSIEFPEYKQDGYMYVCNRAFSGSGLESLTVPYYLDLGYASLFQCYNLKSVKYSSGCNIYSYLSYIFWNVDDVIIYYPKSDPSFNFSVLYNYQHKDSLKFVPYSDNDKKYNCSYTFTHLQPESTYIVGVNNGTFDFDSPVLDSVIYFDQLKSDSKGNLKINYTIADGMVCAVPFVLGTEKLDISDAEIKVPEIVFTGNEHEKPDNYKVTYEGKELIDGVDYVVTSDSGYDCPGNYRFTIVGIGNYCGTCYQFYTVLGSQYDVDGDDMITIKDSTAIQLYIAGIRDLENPDAADANCDGVINIEDSTYIQKLLAQIPQYSDIG